MIYQISRYVYSLQLSLKIFQGTCTISEACPANVESCQRMAVFKIAYIETEFGVRRQVFSANMNIVNKHSAPLIALGCAVNPSTTKLVRSLSSSQKCMGGILLFGRHNWFPYLLSNGLNFFYGAPKDTWSLDFRICCQIRPCAMGFTHVICTLLQPTQMKRQSDFLAVKTSLTWLHRAEPHFET